MAGHPASLRAAATLAALLPAAFGAVERASAEPAIGLSGERTLVTLDTDVMQSMGRFALPGAGRLLGIDWRPADRMLYAVTGTGDILRVDLFAQTAIAIATTSIGLPSAGPVAVDFDPVTDALRVISGVTTYRIDPDTGATPVGGALHYGRKTGVPAIVASAYSNSFGTPQWTVRYDIDIARGALMRQTGADDAVLTPVGPLGIAPADSYAFDIGADPDGKNTAWLVADDTLYTVSLEDGSVTASWSLPQAARGLRDIAILSDM